jgi:hypothetical protein
LKQTTRNLRDSSPSLRKDQNDTNTLINDLHSVLDTESTVHTFWIPAFAGMTWVALLLSLFRDTTLAFVLKTKVFDIL